MIGMSIYFFYNIVQKNGHIVLNNEIYHQFFIHFIVFNEIASRKGNKDHIRIFSNKIIEKYVIYSVATKQEVPVVHSSTPCAILAPLKMRKDSIYEKGLSVEMCEMLLTLRRDNCSKSTLDNISNSLCNNDTPVCRLDKVLVNLCIKQLTFTNESGNILRNGRRRPSSNYYLNLLTKMFQSFN